MIARESNFYGETLKQDCAGLLTYLTLDDFRSKQLYDEYGKNSCINDSL